MGTRLIVFGAGNVGKNLLEHFRNDLEIVAYIDNNIDIVGKNIEDIPICSVEILKYEKFDYLIIASNVWQEMEHQAVYDFNCIQKKILFAPGTYGFSVSEFLDTNPWKIYKETYIINFIKELAMNEHDKYKRYYENRMLANKYYHEKYLNEVYDESNLTTLNDKIRFMEANIYGKFEKNCTDKYQVRKYLQYLGLDSILPKLYFVKESIGELKFEELPEKFVLKINNGCGYNIICGNKNNLKWEYELQRLKRWWIHRHELFACEWHYEGIKKKIICEQLLENNDGTPLVDYKYFCCNGIIKCILVCDERNNETGDSFHYYYDCDWKPLDYAKGIVKKSNGFGVNRPNNLDDMNNVARKLSAIFPFVRVDLYNVEGKIYFGELTFSPCGGLITIQSDECQTILGESIDLDYMKEKRENIYKQIWSE